MQTKDEHYYTKLIVNSDKPSNFREIRIDYKGLKNIKFNT